MMEKLSKITKIILFFVINFVLILILYNIPIKNNSILENLCLYKLLFKKECFNCGMTRAFLSIIQGSYNMAISYNWKCVIIFPLMVCVYLYSWYKYIVKNNV